MKKDLTNSHFELGQDKLNLNTEAKSQFILYNNPNRILSVDETNKMRYGSFPLSEDKTRHLITTNNEKHQYLGMGDKVDVKSISKGEVHFELGQDAVEFKSVTKSVFTPQPYSFDGTTSKNLHKQLQKSNFNLGKHQLDYKSEN